MHQVPARRFQPSAHNPFVAKWLRLPCARHTPPTGRLPSRSPLQFPPDTLAVRVRPGTGTSPPRSACPRAIAQIASLPPALRFEWAGKPYILKFYPRAHNPLKRLLRGSPAWREFVRLQLLQKRKIPAPRVVSHLSGYWINGIKGDAIILESIEPAVQLDEYLNDHLLHGEQVPDRYELGQKVLDLVHDLGSARLGHSDLHLGNMLLKEGKLYLLDGYAVHTGGLKMRDVQLLAHSVSRSATRTELLRGWDMLRSGVQMPRKNPVRKRQWRKFLESAVRENDYFGKFSHQGWSGFFYKHNKFPRRWAPVSRHDASREDWHSEWPNLLARIESDQLELLKRSRSGDVLAGQIVLGGRPVEVVIKRPKRSKLHRYLTEIGRGTRVRRAWKKAWALVVRDIPTAWPLLVMERRILGYAVDGIIVFERVAGTQTGRSRSRCARTAGPAEPLPPPRAQSPPPGADRPLAVRLQVHQLGHPRRSPARAHAGHRRCGRHPPDRSVPVAHRPPAAQASREHPQYTPEDSRELCLGYAPFAHLLREPVAPKPAPETMDDASSQ